MDTCRKSVVITGMGIVSALGNDLTSFTTNLFGGVSGVRTIEAFDVAQRRTKTGATVTGFDASAYIEKRHLHTLDRVSQMAIVAAEQAIAQASLDLEKERTSTGVMLGTALGPSASIEETVLRAAARERLRPTSVLKIMLSSPTAALVERYRLRGASDTHVTACAASSHAIAHAADYIRSGELEVCLAGGSDAFPSATLFQAWDALEVMTTSNDDPPSSVRPFAKNRNGFAIGEGAAILVLESREHAEKRGANILAELAGYGSASDAPSMTKPSAEGMELAMRKALSSAGMETGDIGYVNAHGTATAINDLLETQALHSVFGPQANKLRISSTKAAHGHAMGASGALEAVATVQSLRLGFAPPTLNLREFDPQCDLDYTPLQSARMDTCCALSNSFAFGGHYVTLAFRQAEYSVL
jgi:3-oxoacyl-(acyl-carrier-protein) synthase